MTNPEDACPFCSPEPDRVIFETDLVRAVWDAFPVNPGHVLLLTRRHVPTWFDATRDEQHALVAALDRARDEILSRHPADAFNIGINVGALAGQTIFHLHVHLIPRVRGDVKVPRGGVRHVVPSRGNYPGSR